MDRPFVFRPIRSKIKAAHLPVIVYTLHDGNILPRELRARISVDKLNLLQESFFRERDWGAGLVANVICRALGLPGYFDMCLARCFIDVARPPGLSAPGDSYRGRKAVFEPMLTLANRDSIVRSSAERYYREFEEDVNSVIKAALEISRSIIAIGVHTFDPNGPDGERTTTMVGYRFESIQRLGRPSVNHLANDGMPSTSELTADLTLVHAMSSALSNRGIYPDFNFPYCIPDVEMRWPVLAGKQLPGTRIDEETRDRLSSPKRLQLIMLELRKDLLLNGGVHKEGWYRPTDGSFCSNVEAMLEPIGAAIADGVSSYLSKAPC